MSDAVPPRERPSSREARAVLRRVAQESGPPPRQADAEEGDWAERWGRRIGRVLSLLVTAAILAWLALHLFGG